MKKTGKEKKEVLSTLLFVLNSYLFTCTEYIGHQ